MTDLEPRYRRLLALLPWEHRRRYEDEMLGVLLDGAKEGQRHPRPAETADLLLTAVRLHLRATGRGLGDPQWTNAAALVGALAALAMVGLGVRRIVGTAINSYLWNPPLGVSDGDVFRAAIWVLVVVAAVLGRRWTAACLALAGAAAELAAFGYVYGGDPAFAGYPAVAGLFAAVLGVAALWTLSPAVRRRAVALVAVPASVVVVLYVAPYGTGSDVLASFLLSAPALVLALGVVGVHRREERMRLLDIGRATERNRPVEV